jgi:hypothetical protein
MEDYVRRSSCFEWQQHVDVVGSTSLAGVWLCGTAEENCRKGSVEGILVLEKSPHPDIFDCMS